MDLALINGNVITMTRQGERAEAIAVKDGRIALVGDSATVRKAAGNGAEIVDLGGRTLLPGFIDSHVHAFATGLGLVAADVLGASTVADICQAISEQAAVTPVGQWVFALNCTPWNLREGRYPTRQELDAASPDHPALVCSATFHSSASNSVGLAAIMEGGRRRGWRQSRDEVRAHGWFLSDEDHLEAARTAFGSLSDATIADLYGRVGAQAASKGVTTVHCMEGQFIEGDRDVTVLQTVASRLPVNTVLYYQTMDVQRAVDMGLSRVGGCVMVDGACFEHTACFYDPYLDAPDSCGTLNYTEGEVERFITEAHDAGLQVSMHAIGDRAIDLLVQVYVRTLERRLRPDHRHRIEHFQAPTDWALEQVARLGIAVGAQPIFSYLWDQPGRSDYARQFGVERASRMEALASYERNGVLVAGGSDSPVTRIDPLLGVHSAVNNPGANRRLSVDGALRLFTTNGAAIAHEESIKGTVEVGKIADLVVLSGDPFARPECIKDLVVELTIRGGIVTFDSGRLN